MKQEYKKPYIEVWPMGMSCILAESGKTVIQGPAPTGSEGFDNGNSGFGFGTAGVGEIGLSKRGSRFDG